MKKIAAFLLAALMLSTAVFAEDMMVIAPNPLAKTVRIRVEGIENNLFDGTVAWTEGMTVLSAMETALTGAGVEYVIKESPYGGKYVSAVGTDAEGAFGGYDGWMYYVDSQSPMFSIDAYVLNGGEEVLVAYADMSAVLPILSAERDAEGAVTVAVTADVTTYDEANNWAPVVTRQPMEGVTVTADGAVYITDAEGKALLSAESAAKEAITVQVEKIVEGSAPTLIRLAPGFRLALPMAEKPWYAPYLETLAQAGVTVGQPDADVTRADVVTALFALSGGTPVNYILPFADVAQEAAYAEAVRWAASQKIVNGFGDGTFRPDANVTRQDLAVMLARWQQAAGIVLPTDSAAPAFADNDRIAPYAAEAVYALQKAGVVSGSDGKFNPTATANWAQMGKMLSAFVISD